MSFSKMSIPFIYGAMGHKNGVAFNGQYLLTELCNNTKLQTYA